MKRIIAFLVLCSVLAGCGMESYAPVPENMHVLVTTNIKDGSVSFIDTDTRQEAASWELQKAVMGSAVLPNDHTILLYGKQLEHIYVYSMRTGKQTDEWPVGTGISNVLISSAGDVILADQNQNLVRLYTSSGQEKTSIRVGNGPMTMVEKGGKLYVVNFHDTKLSVVDLESGAVERDIIVPKSSIGALLEDNGLLWLGGHGGDEINVKARVYASATGALEQEVAAPQMPVSFAEDEAYVYVLSHGSSTIRKINKETYEEESSLEIGSNPFALFLIDKTLYAASYDSDEVYVIDAETMKAIEAIPVGEGPFHLTERKGEHE